MSKVKVGRAQSVPVAIPLSPPPTIDPAERPTLKRKAPRSPGRRIPWLWVITGGSAAWALLILAVGASADRPESSVEHGVVTPQAFLVPVTAPTVETAVQEAHPPALAVEEDEPDLSDIVAAPQVLWPKAPVDEMPPPLHIEPEPVVAKPEPPPAPKRRLVDTTIYASCEQVGSDILFMKNPVDAFKKAAQEKKLVFMVHLSGNLEDPGFT